MSKEDLMQVIQAVINWLNSYFRVNTSELRYMTIDVTVATGTAAGTVDNSNQEQLDRQYNKVIGIAYHQITDGGATGNYQVGFQTQKRVWIDPMNIGGWQNANVAPDKKFLSINVPYGSGDTAYAIIVPGANLASDLTGQMVLLLQADLTEMPR